MIEQRRSDDREKKATPPEHTELSLWASQQLSCTIFPHSIVKLSQQVITDRKGQD